MSLLDLTIRIEETNYRPARHVAQERYPGRLNPVVEKALKNCWVAVESTRKPFLTEGVVRIKPSKEFLRIYGNAEEAERWFSAHPEASRKKAPKGEVEKHPQKDRVVVRAVQKYGHPLKDLRVQEIDLTLRQLIGLIKPLEAMSRRTCKLQTYESPTLPRKNAPKRQLPTPEAWVGRSSDGTRFALLVTEPYNKGGRSATDLLAMKHVWISEDPIKKSDSLERLTQSASETRASLVDSKARDACMLEVIHRELKRTSYRKYFEPMVRNSVHLPRGSPAQVKKKQKGCMVDWVIESHGLSSFSVSESGQRKGLRIIAGMLAGLATVDIVHGDLKLDNMLRTSDPDKTGVPSFVLADFGGSFLAKECPFEKVEQGKCLSTFSPDRVHSRDLDLIMEILSIRDEEDTTQFLIRVAELFCGKELRDNVPELTQEGIPYEVKGGLSEIILIARLFRTHGVAFDNERLESKESKILASHSHIQNLREKGLLLLKRRAMEIHRKRDVFAAGIDLFALFTGKMPYSETYAQQSQGEGGKTHSKLWEKQQQTLNRDVLLRGQVVGPIADLIINMLQADYTLRPDGFAILRKQRVIEQVLMEKKT